MILESMKIEHTITAPFSGVIEKINYSVGAMVDKGILLFNIRR